MKIFNVRLGLATNSSSSHSLVLVDRPLQDRDLSGREFGWNDFIVASKEAKLDYLSLLLYYTLSEMCSKEVTDTIISAWLGFEGSISDRVDFDDMYIDHQSAFKIPRAWTGMGVDYEFCRALKELFLRDDMVVLGGNDNEDSPPTTFDVKTLKLPFRKYGGNIVARRDSVYDYWTIFNRDTGCKIRFSFSENAVIPERAFAPELVDVKITNKCNRECPWCYQSSTPDGETADTYDIYRVAKSLAELKVFEVAIGGGEPLLVPSLALILQQFRQVGIVPNFTTRETSWLRDPTRWQPIMAQCGSFALSVSHPDDVIQLSGLLSVNGISSSRVAVQFIPVVVGVLGTEKILEVAGICNLRATLLGYKRSGRGAQYNLGQRPVSAKDIWPVIDKELTQRYSQISLDTALAAELGDTLKNSDISSWLYHLDEGKFSWYIDAVDRKMGPCSYSVELENISHENGIVQNLGERILTSFANNLD